MLQEMYYWMMYFLKKIGKYDIPFNSCLLMLILMNANIMTVIMFVTYLFNIDLKGYDSKIIGLLVLIPLFIFNYFYLYRNRDKITDKYDNIVRKRKKRGILYFWIYSVLSIVLLFVIGVNLFPYFEK
jgi:hypothetical protein